MIYLDQAATSHPKPAEVVEAICLAVQSAGNSGRGSHELSLASSRLVFTARLELAEFLGAEDPRQIVFTANATESLNLALKGVVKPGDHVITTVLEHNSVLRPLYILEQTGVEVTILQSNPLGVIDFTQLANFLRPNTTAVICTGASNVTGNLVDLDYLGEFCSEYRLLLIVDAAQTAGFYPHHVQKQKIDILCFTGHKSLYGPQGVGGIYVKPGIKVHPLKTGGTGVQTFSQTQPEEMPEALEAGTLNTPGIAGLLAALRYIKNKGLEQIRHKEKELTWYFYEEAKEIAGVEVYGDFKTQDRCPIVSLNLRGLNSSLVSRLLAEDYGIFTRAGGHCAPLMHEALGTRTRGVVRFSFSHLNTKDELDQALKALREIERKYRGRGLDA